MGQVKALWGEKYLYTVKARVKSCMIKQVFNQKNRAMKNWSTDYEFFQVHSESLICEISMTAFNN